MNVAIIRDRTVENIIVCNSSEDARQLYPDATCVDAAGLAIGDQYPKPVVPPLLPHDPPMSPAQEPYIVANADRDAMLIDHEFRLTLLELGGDIN